MEDVAFEDVVDDGFDLFAVLVGGEVAGDPFGFCGGCFGGRGRGGQSLLPAGEGGFGVAATGGGGFAGQAVADDPDGFFLPVKGDDGVVDAKAEQGEVLVVFGVGGDGGGERFEEVAEVVGEDAEEAAAKGGETGVPFRR